MTPFDLAQRFVGEVREVPGPQNSPFIQWCLESCGMGPEEPDETAWCSAFVNRIAWLLRLPRSKSAAARSWLGVGQSVDTMTVGYDVVILSRGSGPQPDASVLNAPGHVGFFAGWGTDGRIMILGGNQGDTVSIAPFDVSRVLGIRRIRGAS